MTNLGFSVAATAAGAMICSAANAELSLPIAWRVLSFMQPPPAGSSVAILVDPSNPASEADAVTIERSLSGGAIKSHRVSPGMLGSLSAYRAVFVTVGTRSAQPELAAAASKASVVTITSDPGCVRAGYCVVGITSQPRVQITVNRAAAKAANIRFGSAFLMLVKEI